MALPQGYKTLVGEGGSTLSGGEKQRISIARAILKDAPKELTQNKTLISIAHRLTTVRDADQIVVIEDGKLVENGTHRQLIDRPEGL